MIQVPFDDVLRERLGDLTGAVQICDASGRVLAQVLPVVGEQEIEYLTPDVGEEELDRRAQSDERRYSTAEVIEYLESL